MLEDNSEINRKGENRYYRNHPAFFIGFWVECLTNFRIIGKLVYSINHNS